MFPPLHTLASPCSATALHRSLNARAALYARHHGLLHEFTTGRSPSILFGEDAAGRHGNFLPESYRAILARRDWRARLGKTHTGARAARPRADWPWRELDCAASSDALLMNIFCYPGLLASGTAAALLGVSSQAAPRFGVHPRLACERNLIDMTEVDMELDGLLVEAKLTESGFQSARPALLARYTAWQPAEGDSLFDDEALPRTAAGGYAHYQLLRGVLAASSTGGSFCLLLDARRTDLIGAWHAVLSAVESPTLRCQLKLLTWQELAAAVPKPLQGFLAEKYGILPA